MAYDAMVEEDAEQIIGKVVAKALEGDMNAATNSCRAFRSTASRTAVDLGDKVFDGV